MILNTTLSTPKAQKFYATLPHKSLLPPSKTYLQKQRSRVSFVDFLEANGPLDVSKYYVPHATNNPLYDAFTVDVTDAGPESAASKPICVLSIFQMSTSMTHGGSAHGYDTIKRLIELVAEQAEPLVELQRSKSRGQYADSDGRPQRATKIMHKSKVFEVEIKVHFIYVCPHTPLGELQWTMPEGWQALQNRVPDGSHVFCQPLLI